MRRDNELQAGAIEMASWLWDNREQFRPLEIVRVEPSVIDTITGELAIRLGVVLEDPADYVQPHARSTDEAA